MKELIEQLNDPTILIYIGIVIGSQILYAVWDYWRNRNNARRRRSQGLPEGVLINHSERLASRRFSALLQSGLLLASIFLTPFILVGIAKNKEGLAIAFLVLFGWIVFNGTDVIKAFLTGLAFKTIAAFKQPFQVGDRVTLKGISGKVVRFNTFFVVLQTPNDDQISIPTHSLWTEVLISANGGDRSSLCVMNFYLASFVNAQQRQKAEDAIWNAIQASVYYEPSKPMQIYLSQTPEAICLTAKAYVASTYNEPLFASDVTRAFLDFVSQEQIPLAPSAWELGLEMSPISNDRFDLSKSRSR